MIDENTLPSNDHKDDSPDVENASKRLTDEDPVVSIEEHSLLDSDAVIVSNISSEEGESVQVSQSYAELLQRRTSVTHMMEEAKDNLREGLPYCLIPAQWFQNFMSGNFDQTDDSIVEKIGAIDTRSLLDETQVLVDERAQYVSLPESCFEQLKNWFGLKEGSLAIVRRVIFENGVPSVDVFPQLVYPHVLCPPELVTACSDSNVVPFLISKRNTLKELKDILISMFSLSEFPSRIWSIQLNNGIDAPAVFSPQNIDDLKSRQLLPTSKKTGMRANALRQLGKINHVLIETQYNGEWIMNQVTFLKPGTGLIGLNNLGNTCYMNSALQCLVHIPELLYYFLYDFYEKEINVDNPLGNQGKVAISFANLIKNLFDSREFSNHGSIAPRDFKTTIGYFNSMFADYHQQDSQEFIAFLLDGLHEDLNRILKKPYVEKPELEDGNSSDYNEIKKFADSCWDAHKQRNNSVVVDLFVGMYKSTLVCPDCGKVSITFDPYNDLTLPLPVQNNWNHTVKVLLEEGYPQSLEVELAKSSTFADLKHYVSAKLNVPVNELIALELFNSQVYKNFESKDSDIRYLPISDLINAHDDIWFYQVSHRSGDLVVPVFNTVASESNAHFSKAFGIPFFITLSESESYSYGAIRRKLEKKFSQLSSYDYFEKNRSDRDKFTRSDFPLLSFSSTKLKSSVNSVEAAVDAIEIADDGDYNSESDISLASPNISGNYGFSMKLFDSSKESRNTGYSRLNRYSNFSRNNRNDYDDDDEDDSLWIPSTNNNFGRLPDLLDKLPERKRAFYTYDKSSLEATESAKSMKKDAIESESIPKSDIDEEAQYNLPSIDIARISSDPRLAEAESMSTSEELPNSSPLVVQSISSDESSLELGLEALTGNDGVDCEDDTKMTDSGDYEDALEPRNDDESVSLREIDDELEKIVKLVDEKNALVCQWDQESFDTFFTGIEDEGQGGAETWSNPQVFLNEELEAKKKEREDQMKKNITLDDCMNLFSSEEVLGEHDLWFCPSCKEHRQASKKLEIWSTPDILTIHLKRFENQKSFSDKIDAIVDFPIEGLDMSKYIVNESGDELVYDLFAVDNHYGGLGGGHYTAYVKNFLDGKWYYYDDSRVSPADPQNAIQGSAYLLFYRKRSSTPLGGKYFQETMADIQEKETKTLEFRDALQREVNMTLTQSEVGGGVATRVGDSQNSPPAVVSQVSIPLMSSDYTSVDSEMSTNLNNSESGFDSSVEDTTSPFLHELKRRKKMKRPLRPHGSKHSELDLLDSGLASPLSDDDNLSTYSFSTTTPAYNNDNDDVNSIIGEYNS